MVATPPSTSSTDDVPSRPRGTRLKWLPRLGFRFLHWLLLRVFYRVRMVGRENIPETGGALLVCNHLSYADPFFVAAGTRRNIRFRDIVTGCRRNHMEEDEPRKIVGQR